jgi:hypothetical protein
MNPLVEALRNIVREGEKTSPDTAVMLRIAREALAASTAAYIRPADDPHTLVAKALSPRDANAMSGYPFDGC